MKKNILSVLPSIPLLLLLSLCSGCSNASGNDCHGIDLAGTWKIIESDIPENAMLSFDDSKYPDLEIPGSWLNVLKKNNNLASTVWIRKKIFIGNSNIMKQPLLFIERIAVADEAYFNGIKIGSSGIFPAASGDLHYQISWNMPRKYFIPENLVRYGDYNVIALRVYSHIQSGVMGEAALQDYYQFYFEQIMNTYKPLFISIAAVILNLMLISVFITLFISERKKTEYLYFFLIIACTLLCIFLTFTLPFMIDGLLRYKLGLLLYTLTNFFVFLGVKKFLSYGSNVLIYTSSALLVIVEMSVLLAPSSKFLVFCSSIGCLVFVNLCILGSLTMFILAAKKDPRRYWYFLLVAIPVSISVLRNSYVISSYRFNELPMTIFMHVPVVFMFITLFTIYDFEKSKNEKDLLYKTLLKKSKNDIRQLQSLKDKNRKPEPREIIADVIEYLDVNFNEKYDRLELSKRFGLNEDYMGQIFKKATGTNISNYINSKRISAAKELVADTRAKIIDIAYHVGFDNLTHFHRQFKIQTGCTPNEYRKNIKKNDA